MPLHLWFEPARIQRCTQQRLPEIISSTRLQHITVSSTKFLLMYFDEPLHFVLRIRRDGWEEIYFLREPTCWQSFVTHTHAYVHIYKTLTTGHHTWICLPYYGGRYNSIVVMLSVADNKTYRLYVWHMRMFVQCIGEWYCETKAILFSWCSINTCQ